MKRFIFFAIPLILMLFIATEVITGQIISNDGRIPIILFTQSNANEPSDADLDKMCLMGTDAVVAADFSISDYNRYSSKGLKMLPYQIHVDSNFIVRYTDAYYTNWEAEGNTDHGANWKYDTTKGMPANENGNPVGIKTQPGIQAGVLMNGPGYGQSVEYKLLPYNGSKYIQYSTIFRTKIERYDSLLQLDSIGNNVVCVLKVTLSQLTKDAQSIYADTIVAVDTIRISDYSEGEWKQSILDYNLEAVAKNYLKEIHDESTEGEKPKFNASFVQFIVEWGGINGIQLVVDKVIVGDQVGFRLKNNPEFVTYNIYEQISGFPNDEYIPAWFPLDEPPTIDNYEPFRIVNAIVDSLTDGKKIFIAFNSFWNGNYGDGNLGTNGLRTTVEFQKRTGFNSVNVPRYIFDSPRKSDYETYRQANIEAIIYNVLNNVVANYQTFGTVSQAFGAYAIDSSETPAKLDTTFRIPTLNEMLYLTNLGLLYGSKQVGFYTFFSGLHAEPYDDLPSLDGILDINKEPTERYYLIKDVISPRFKGLFGKILSQSNSTNQVPNISIKTKYSPAYPNLRYIESINTGATDSFFIDLGSFESQETTYKDYFMILNRYYNNQTNLRIGVGSLCDYLNWTAYNYTDTSYKSLIAVNDTALFIDSIGLGDAKLYGIKPAVLYGGDISINESISGTNTLLGELKIKSSKTLTVNGTYNCYKNLVVESGGSLIVSPGSTINFLDGAKLVNSGSTSIVGTAANKINLNCSNNQTEAVSINNGGTLNIRYAIIRNCNTAITANAAGAISIQNCEINNAAYGIDLLNLSQSQIPIIKNNTIDVTETAISASYGSGITIQQNNISSKLGIYLNQVSNAGIYSNTITSTLNQQSGIFFSSSFGLVRNNAITGHANGISLLYSSPKLGANIINNNYVRGMYIGSASVPDLSGELVRVPCTTLPLFYSICGNNTIYENGAYYIRRGGEDGGEINIYYGNILLANGCNQIFDDREPAFNLPTQNLISGVTTQDILIEADGNSWGACTYYQLDQRFGGLSVEFDPVGCYWPQSGITECPIVIQTTEGGIDTLFGFETDKIEFSDLELYYSDARGALYSGDYQSATSLFYDIVENYGTESVSTEAYLRLYDLERINGDLSTFQSYLNQKIEETANPILIVLLDNLLNLCNVDLEEYTEAAISFIEIINNEEDSDASLNAELNLLTTSLLSENEGGLGKMSEQFVVANRKEYQEKIKSLLANKFGGENSTGNKVIVPKEYELTQNYPNPFNPVTTIKYGIKERTDVRIDVFDILGRKITTLVNDQKDAGYYEVVFDASKLSSGVYIYRLTTKDFTASRKMMVVK